MAEVFISYAREDQVFARDLNAGLQKLQRETWIDWRSIPDSAQWRAEIFAAIEGADNFLFIISPDSLRSWMCGQEVAHATANKKRIVTILYHPVETKDLFPGIAEVQWISYPELGFKRTFQRLIAAIDTNLHWVRRHTHFGLRAAEWEASGRDNGFLLHGMELREAVRWLEEATTIKNQQPAELHEKYIRASEEWEAGEIQRLKDLNEEKERQRHEAERQREEEERVQRVFHLYKRLYEQLSAVEFADPAYAMAEAEDLLLQVEDALRQWPYRSDLRQLRNELYKFLGSVRRLSSAEPSNVEPPEAFIDTFHYLFQRAASHTSAQIVPRKGLIDNVHFSLTGPLVLGIGMAHELRFWVHVEEQRAAVLQVASLLHGIPRSEMNVKSEGPYPLKRESRLSVRMAINGLRCVDSHKWIFWLGEIGNTAFLVEVPRAAPEGAYAGKASVRLNGCEIATMSFLVRVGPPNLVVREMPLQTTPYRSAFASYASEDRGEVLSRVQGMEAAYKGLRVFVDVVGIRSGQNWERELARRISDSDVFYLFWCRHAMNSAWVEKEWRWALSTKGIDFIDPIPLQSPESAPPPRELASKQFNDPLLAFIAVAGGAHPD